MKKIILRVLFTVVLIFGVKGTAHATPDVYLTVKNNGAIVYSGNIALPPAGTTNINDSGGTPHNANADSVLSILNNADALTANFNISNLIYYNSFGAFYLKCITVSPANELCDDWQYKVNGDSPAMGMDSEILSGGENVVIYFGSDSAPAEGAQAVGPLVANPPPPPDWMNPEETHNTPTPAPVSSPSLNNPPLSSLSLASPNLAIKYVGTEENKPELKTPPKIQKNTKKQILTATAINAVTNPPLTNKTTPPKRGWFTKLLDNIWNSF